MDSQAAEAALDLRTIKLTDITYPPLLPSFNLCFSQSSHYPEMDSLPLAPFIPALSMTQRVLKAAFTRTGKPTRPFKAYPKNPLSLTMKTSDDLLDRSSNRAYLEFRERMLRQMNSSSTTKRSVSPSTSVTSASGGEHEEGKDSAYWERRKKNNEAAKRSRDARRAKEDEIAIRAAFLEQENIKLKYKVMTLKNELTRMRCILYTR